MDKSPPGASTENVPNSQSVTEIITEPSNVSQEPVLRLRLKKPKTEKKVSWTNATVDNEEMNKKKSKCCCIYKKPPVFGESSSESDDECEHCYGHVEHRKKNKNSSEHHDGTEVEGGASCARTVTMIETPKLDENEPVGGDNNNPDTNNEKTNNDNEINKINE